MKRALATIGIFSVFVLLFAVLSFVQYFVPVSRDDEPELFVVERDATLDDISGKLAESGFVRSAWVADFALGLRVATKPIQSGAYQISRDMSAWGIAVTLTGNPNLKWVTVFEGVRKEEIAETIGALLGWDDVEKNSFLSAHEHIKNALPEGTYFPDTYLIPVADSGVAVAERMANRFHEQLLNYAAELIERNIKWDTAVTLASLVQREAAGEDDMSLIAGILWNRLLGNIRLEVDATIQYVRGDVGEGWWAPIKPEDKEIESLYNTYQNVGLPPFPIANPGMAAVEAVIYPADTECLYYIHDAERNTHCSETYEGHLENIQQYLR